MLGLLHTIVKGEGVSRRTGNDRALKVVRLSYEFLEDRRFLSVDSFQGIAQLRDEFQNRNGLISDATIGPANAGGEPAGGPSETQQNAWEGYDLGTGVSSAGGAQKLVAGVPAYRWRHGCGPTAAGMLVGYWDMHGFPQLIPGNSSTQTLAVNAAIASDAHYNDFSRPIDNEYTGTLADKSELGGAHPNNCIADWMHTSWSVDGNLYGWSWMSQVDDALESYCSSKGYPGFTVRNELWGDFRWSDFVGEINNGRPMVFLVDTNGNGATDHFVTAIGYDAARTRYACFNTWDSSVHWYDFRGISPGQRWGISGATFVRPNVSRIIDDGSPGFTAKGDWKRSFVGYGDDSRYNSKGTGAHYAEWTFAALPSGRYEVLTTWKTRTGAATNAPCTVSTGAKQATIALNLRKPVTWKSLGVFNVTRGWLKIRLTDKANGCVIADAVWVRSIPTWAKSDRANGMGLSPPGTATAPQANAARSSLTTSRPVSSAAQGLTNRQMDDLFSCSQVPPAIVDGPSGSVSLAAVRLDTTPADLPTEHSLKLAEAIGLVCASTEACIGRVGPTVNVRLFDNAFAKLEDLNGYEQSTPE